MRFKKSSILLFVILFLNVFQSTAVVGFILAATYTVINANKLINARRSELSLLTYMSTPIAIMFIIGVSTGLIYKNDLYNIFKDAYFFIKVIVYFAFSLVFYRMNNSDRAIDVFIFFGVFISVLYFILFPVYFLSGWLDLSTVSYYRKTIPELSYDPILSIALLLYLPKSRHSLLRKLKWSFLIIQSLAIISTISRLSILILAIVYLIAFRLKTNKITVLSVASIIIFTLFLSTQLLNTDNVPTNSNTISNELVNKTFNIFDEILSSDFDDNKDIVKNWRAYEALQGVNKYLAGSSLERSLGYGFGELTDIGIEIKLGGIARTEIPVFHNGYIYLLVKIGVIGIFLYILFLYRILRTLLGATKRHKQSNSTKRGEAASLQIILIFLIFFTAVFFGIFNNAIFNNISILLMSMMLIYTDRTPKDKNF